MHVRQSSFFMCQTFKGAMPQVLGVQIISADEDNFSVDCHELESMCPPLYANLVTYPREVIPILDDVINKLARELRTAAAADNDGAHLFSS